MTELALKDIQAAVATTIIDEAQGARIITLVQNRRRFCHSITEQEHAVVPEQPVLLPD